MRRSLLLPVVAVALTSLVSCKDSNIPSSPGPNGGAADISDAVHTPTSSGNDLASNPFFFWLPPDAPQPDRSQYQAFDPTLRPTVQLVCLKTTDPSVSSCDPTAALATFSLANGGLTINEPTDGSDSLYIANVDFKNPPLALSTPGGAYTTYRIEVLTQPLGPLGGPYTYGFLDIQVGDNGTTANQLTQPGILGVTDTQTLPIKFRLEEGALVYELGQNNVTYDASQLCQINCSATILPPNASSVALLHNVGPNGGYNQGSQQLAGLFNPSGSVQDYSVLIIDQRDPSPDGNCATGATLYENSCYRLVFIGTPWPNGDDFGGSSGSTPARFGVCPDPSGPETDDGTIVDPKWKLFKAELDADGNVTSYDDFPPADISDFLTCAVAANPQTALWNGPLGRAAGKLVDLFVKPVAASHSLGGTIWGPSDVFWAEYDSLNAVGPTEFSVLSGAAVQPTVQLLAVHPDPDVPIANSPVTFTITGGDGSLEDASGNTGTTLTVNTDANGEATITWTVIGSGNTLTASSSIAFNHTVTFTATPVTGGGQTLYGVNSSDKGLSIIDPSHGKVTHVGTTLDGKNGTKYKAPVALATDAFGTVYAWNNSGSTGSNAGSLLAVDRCTGTASRLMSNGNGHFLGLVGAGQAGSFFGLNTETDAVGTDGTISTVGSFGISGLQIAGVDANPSTNILYGLEATATGGRAGPRLVTIDPSTGTATVVAILNKDVGTVGSIVFTPDGSTLIGSASGAGNHPKQILFTVDTSTGAVTSTTNIQHGEYAPEGMAFAPACPTS